MSTSHPLQSIVHSDKRISIFCMGDFHTMDNIYMLSPRLKYPLGCGKGKLQSASGPLQCMDEYVKDNALDVARPPRPD